MRGMIVFLAVLMTMGLSLQSATPRIVVVGKTDYAPFEFLDSSGTPQGLLVDVWKLWSQKTGIAVNYRLMEGERLPEALKSGQADVIAFLFYDTWHDQGMLDYSIPYYRVDTNIYYHTSLGEWPGVEHTANRSIGVVKGGYAEGYVQKRIRRAIAVPYPSPAALVQAALAGEIKIFMCEAPVASYYLSRNAHGREFKHPAQPLYTQNVYAGVREGNTALLHELNRGLKDISGREIGTIASRWLGVSVSSGTSWKYFALALALIAGAIFTFLAWGYELQRRVKRATAALQQKQAELAHSEEKYRALIETTGTGYFILDLEGRVFDANQAYAGLSGHASPDEIRGQSVLDWTAEAHRTRHAKAIEGIARTHFLANFEVDFLGSSGVVPVEINAALVEMAQGKVILGLCRDITERKRMVQALKESEARFRALSENTSDGIMRFDRDLRFLYVNAKIEEETHIKAADFIGKTFREVGLPEPVARIWEPALLKVFDTGEPVRIEFEVPPDRWVDAILMPEKIEGQVKTVMSSSRDITTLKQAEAAIKESEAKFKALTETAGVGIFIVQGEKIVYANPALSSIMGYTIPEILNVNFWDFIHPDHQGLVKSRGLARQRGAELTSRYEFKYIKKDGSVAWADFTAAAITYAGKPALIATTVDITHRKLAEEAIAEEKERLAVTLRSVGDGVITTDTEGRIIMLNTIAERLTGWNTAETAGKEIREVYAPLDEATRRELAPLAHRAGKIEEGPPGYCVLADRNGREWIIEERVNPIRDKDGNTFGIVIVFHDVTERRRAEEEQIRAQKLESIGILAGGIAHDFNNILAAILGNLSVAKRYADQPDKILARIEQAEKASQKATGLTRQLLTFSKGGQPIRQATHLPELIHTAIDFALVGRPIKCDFSIADDLRSASVDEGQITQVLNNLAINAAQAMPEGGVIRLRAENVTLGADEIPPLPAGPYVKIALEDHGVGIAREHIPLIFDPYFTTKTEGSGLGLATAYSIIRQHGGHITVTSEVGSGTTFNIFLPSADSDMHVPRTATAKRGTTMGKGRVLVMDDEDFIKDVVGSMLEVLGYEAAFADDGAQAVALYQEALDKGARFDAVIMDLTIPGGIGGKEAIKDLRRIDPMVKAIVSSGYSNDPIMSNYREFGFAGVVAKPFQIEDLSDVLEKVIRPNPS